MGMTESSWEVEERAKGKIIPDEMCSTPSVGMRDGPLPCILFPCMHMGSASPSFHRAPSEELRENPCISTPGCTLAQGGPSPVPPKATYPQEGFMWVTSPSPLLPQVASTLQSL